MRSDIVFGAILAIVAGCGTSSKTETIKECFPLIDKAVGSLQKYSMVLDTTYVDSALFYYDDAIRCDSSVTNHHQNKATTLGRYRESLTIIDNVFKVREIPTSRDAHFLQIKGWLFNKLGEKDSSALYYERARQFAKTQGS